MRGTTTVELKPHKTGIHNHSLDDDPTTSINHSIPSYNHKNARKSPIPIPNGFLTRFQAYNSIFNAESSLHLIGNFPLLPLRTRVRGPATTLPPSSEPAHISPEPDSESYDSLDEVLGLFRANTFFRNFEIQGPADRLLIYGILWVSECLGKIRPNMSARYVWYLRREIQEGNCVD